MQPRHEQGAAVFAAMVMHLEEAIARLEFAYRAVFDRRKWNMSKIDAEAIRIVLTEYQRLKSGRA